jgi:DNA polymerase I
MENIKDNRLFLLDAFALIYRGYFALSANTKFNPVNSKGLDTTAILGFTNTLIEVLNKQKPTHIAVVFDTAAPTTRHIEFTEYKANREEMPDAIGVALPYIKEIIKAFHIPVIETDGYEADDIIGTLAKKAELSGYTTYMMTPDKDFGQLVSDNILIYRPGRFGNEAEVLGMTEVCEKFGIQKPEQVIDVLGLMGDAVDNIPGVPGIGPKTASQLITDYGSVENVIANSDKLKGKLKEKIEQYKDQALLSKKLATIITETPVEFVEHELLLEEPDREKLFEIFSELEFRTLSKRILGKEIQVSAASKGQTDLFGEVTEKIAEEEVKEAEITNFRTMNDTEHNYFIADSEEKRKALIEKLAASHEFCFDTETTSLDVHSTELVGLSFSVLPGEAYYVPVTADPVVARQIVNEFRPVLESEKIRKIGQNIKFDYLVLRYYDIELKGELFDTMLAHYLLEPDKKHGMDILSETFLGYRPMGIEELIGKKGKDQGSMRDVPLEKISDYASEDADITLQLKNKFEPMIKKNNAENLLYRIECPLIPVLAEMEKEGINLDIPVLREFSSQLQEELTELEKKIYADAGMTFNIDSPRQLGQILFEVLRIDEKAKKTKTGQYATGEDVLAKLADKHPIVGHILDYRESRKLKSTYVDTLPGMVHEKSGRIHTCYMQAVAATGRLSSNNPNLQNIPIRTEKGREIRKAFIPRNNEYLILSADYSQVELRIIAALSEDEGMIAAFREKQDIHTATAAKVFGVKLEEVSREMRSSAKAVNFGIIYGQSAFGLSQTLGIPNKEAREIIENYFAQYPKIKKYMEQNVKTANEKGYVETIMGRRRYLPDIRSGNATVRGFAERNAINAPIQGSAADIIKIAMIGIHDEIRQRKLRSRMVLQVHDELVFDAHQDELTEVKEIIRQKMEHAVELSVPLEVEMDTGKNWLDAH